MDAKETRGSTRSTSAYPLPQQRKQGRVILLVVTGVILFTIIFSSSTVTGVSSVASAAVKHIPGTQGKLPSLTNLHNPFRQAVHEPPVQSNSTIGDTKWYTDWKWLNPFSSTITLDDTRSVLPPLQLRPSIYTYYDNEIAKDDAIKKAEYKLLTIWRRAWWAQGFRPVILGRAEAMKNPHFQLIQKKEYESAFEQEMMRWLAWGHMGKGILANWLVLPMGPRNDHDLTFLRRGEYPQLTRYEGLGGGIFAGTDAEIDAAIMNVIEGTSTVGKKTFVEAISDPHVFDVEPRPPGIAFYDTKAIASNYQKIADQILDAKAEGLAALADLISAHLHGTFLDTLPNGFIILSAKPKECTLLSAPSVTLANALNTCPQTTLPRSCPPNNSKCRPCEPQRIRYETSISNDNITFTIGTIPHPYTLNVLVKEKDDLSVSYIRRESSRDPWLEKATTDTLAKGISSYTRIVSFKEQVVSDAGQSRAIWHTAERDWAWRDLEWRFGFALSRDNNNDIITLPEPSQTQYPEVLSPFLTAMSKKPSRRAMVRQGELVKAAKERLAKEISRGKKGDMRRVVEAWNLADTEAWRFVRAFEARSRMERRKWEEEESRFLSEDMDSL